MKALLDVLLEAHFKAQIEAKHGARVCDGPKARARLLKACERLKKLLSTIDAAQVVN